MKKIVIMRHFPSDANHWNYIGGHSNIWLSQRWYAQAELFAQFYAWQFDQYKIITSTLQRNQETLAELLKYNTVWKIIASSALQERNFWPYIGMSTTDMIDGLKKEYNYIHHDSDITSWLEEDLIDDGGNMLIESTRMLQQRIMNEMMFLMSEPWDQNILFIGHTGTIRVLLMTLLWITNSQLDTLLWKVVGESRIPHGALTTILLDHNKTKLEKIMDVPSDLQQQYDLIRNTNSY